MPSPHKTAALSIRITPEAERQRLTGYAERHGMPVRQAIREMLDREQEDP